ncbi:MAG TPA: YlmC/YmxH family sporulation protein [Syntrophaceticus sp.]|nr:YlmC/YmxH family sporulation protein [Syntrophaceticus sp.]
MSELRLHDVINVIDGKRLGMIRDIDIDVETGRVKSLIIPNRLPSMTLITSWSRSSEIFNTAATSLNIIYYMLERSIRDLV